MEGHRTTMIYVIFQTKQHVQKNTSTVCEWNREEVGDATRRELI